jgi:hypothetical protein
MLPSSQNLTLICDISDAFGAVATARASGVLVRTVTNTTIITRLADSLNSTTLNRPAAVDTLLSTMIQVSAAAAGGCLTPYIVPRC